jgi:hypothetical protein
MEAGAMSDHPRDCPHGRQWGKCDTCDLIEANATIERLREALRLIADTTVSQASAHIAEAALQALIQPSLDPRAGRVLAMREEGQSAWMFVSGTGWTRQS